MKLNLISGEKNEKSAIEIYFSEYRARENRESQKHMSNIEKSGASTDGKLEELLDVTFRMGYYAGSENEKEILINLYKEDVASFYALSDFLEQNKIKPKIVE